MWDVGIFGAGRPERAFSTELLIYSEIVSNWAKIWHLRLPLIKINVSKPQYSTIPYHTTILYRAMLCYIIQYHAKDTTPYYYPKYEIQSNEREKMWNNPSQHSCSFKFGLFPLSLNGQKRWTFASLLSIHCTPLTLSSCQVSLTSYNWAACCWIK